MSAEDFYKFTCTSTDLPGCTGCPKIILVSVFAVSEIHKSKNGKALIALLRPGGMAFCPRCKEIGYIETDDSFDTFISDLNILDTFNAHIITSLEENV